MALERKRKQAKYRAKRRIGIEARPRGEKKKAKATKDGLALVPELQAERKVVTTTDA